MVAEKDGPSFTSRANAALIGFRNLITDLINKSREVNLSTLLAEVVNHSNYREYLLNDDDGEERWENSQ